MHVTDHVQDVILPGDEIDRRDALRRVLPDVSTVGSAHRAPVDDRKCLPELVVEFPPPLVSQVGRGDDKGAFDKPSELEFLDRQPSHDRLPGTRIVCDQEPDAGLGQQVGVDRIDLMRQRIDLRHGDSEVGVVLEGEPNAMCLGGEAKVGRVPIEGSELPSVRQLDGLLKVLQLEELRPEALGEDADCLDLDSGTTSLGREHSDGLCPMRTFEDRALRQLAQDAVGSHLTSPTPASRNRSFRRPSHLTIASIQLTMGLASIQAGAAPCSSEEYAWSDSTRQPAPGQSWPTVGAPGGGSPGVASSWAWVFLRLIPGDPEKTRLR